MGLKRMIHQWLHPQPAQPIVPDYVVERVGHGAALLDAQKPGWALEVLPAYIDLTSQSACVLGQVYGSFAKGMQELRPAMVPVDYLLYATQPTQTMRYGFCVDRLEDLPLFKAEWGRVIEERLRAHFASA